jgi:hypothetical protein
MDQTLYGGKGHAPEEGTEGKPTSGQMFRAGTVERTQMRVVLRRGRVLPVRTADETGCQPGGIKQGSTGPVPVLQINYGKELYYDDYQ